jgi:hypothetical protein
MAEQDHYRVLAVSRGASATEIKRRYRALMREAHPDAAGGGAEANRRAASINLAYEVLGDPQRRRAYDERTLPRGASRRDAVYAHWAQQPDWEDIVAAHAPPRRKAHRHSQDPYFEPEELVVTLDELRASPRVRRALRLSNPCDCTLRGNITTSSPWVWGPIGSFEVRPGGSLDFDIEVISRRVEFPGVARVQFGNDGWTSTATVKVAGYEPKARRKPPATEVRYARGRARRRSARAR